MDILIRDAKPEDAKQTHEIFYKTWLSTYPNVEYGITEDDVHHRFKDSLTEEKILQRQKEFAELPDGTKRVLVAEHAGKVVGICRLTKDDAKNYLKAIYILPEYQGKGIGGMLWNEALMFFDKDKPIEVEVAVYNAQAIAFYKKLGFADIGERFSDERFRLKSGNIIPEIRMTLKH